MTDISDSTNDQMEERQISSIFRKEKGEIAQITEVLM